MKTSETFQEFLFNIKIQEDKANTISYRYGRITKSLNEYFRNTDSKTANSLQVGSYGRYSGIKGISDLDMLYIMPSSKWDTYNKNGGQSQLLADTKTAISNTYSASDIKVDRCVVTVKFSDGTHIDVQPVFEIEDKDYKYPDTYNDGSWKVTKPRKEMDAMVESSQNFNRNLRRLCKMARSWKMKNGVVMSGLLIDTLAYNFLNSTSYYDEKSFSYYDEMSRDFFKFLYDQPKDQKEYGALGSKQRVKVRKPFKRKAKKAYDLACEAIDATSEKTQHNKWRDIYGNDFPKYSYEENEAKAINMTYHNTEEFIEDIFPINILYDLEIECDIKQNGFREGTLSYYLLRKFPLLPGKKLHFYIKSNSVPFPYEVKWKVTNRGEEAIRKDCIRGQIVADSGNEIIVESTNFRGEHFVECYIIKDGIVVAKDSIDVPISTNS